MAIERLEDRRLLAVGPYPLPLAPLSPAGGLVYETAAEREIGAVGAVDTLELAIDAGQTVTVSIDPLAGLRAALEIRDSGGELVGSESAAAGGEALLLQTLPLAEAGTYTISVSGVDDSVGGFNGRVLLNAAIEAETLGGATNDDPGTAQSLAGSFIPLVGTAERGAVVGSLSSSAAIAYEANMDVNPGWTLQGDWQYGQPTGSGSHNRDPASGFTGDNVIGYNLSGDYPDRLSIQYATTPVFSTLGATGVSLSFMRWLGLEGCCDNAAVQVSNDGGSRWTTVWAGASSDSSWIPQTFDISAIADDQANVRLRWSMGSTDGSVTYPGWNIDDVLVSSRIPTAPDWYRFELADGQSASLALAALTGSGLSLDLFAADGTTHLAGGVDAANADQVINNFVDGSSDGVDNTYYVRVTGADADYSLVVTRGADFDTESNDGLPPEAQDISTSGIALGHVGVGEARLFGIQPVTDQIVQVDPTTGAILASFPAPVPPDASVAGLSGAEHGATLIYQTSGANSTRLFRLNPADGAVLSEETMTPGARGGLSFESDITDYIYAIDDGGPVDRQDGFSGLVTPFFSVGNPSFPGALGGDDYGRHFVAQGGTIVEFDPFTPDTQLNSIPAPGGSGVSGLAFDGTNLFASYSGGSLYTLDPDTGDVLDVVIVVDGGLIGLGVAGNAVGADFFRVSVNAGDTLTISTTTPAGGPGEFVNELDPSIELFDPTGASVAVDDNSAADGRNALLNHTAALSGPYTVRVFGAADTSGEYVLNVSGFSGALPPFAVDSTMPVDGSALNLIPSTYEVHFNDQVDLSTLEAGDLLINGAPATQIDAVGNSNTVVFTLPALGDGTHSVEIVGGSIFDVQGTAIDPFSATFTVDTTGPRVISSSVGEGDTVLGGELTATIRFDELLNEATLGAADVVLIGALTGAHAADVFSYDGPSSTLTLGYNSLLDDNYTLTLTSGDGAFEDSLGNDLDGEPLVFPLPPNVSGDGVPGGDFVVNFSLDLEITPFPTPLDPRQPLGSLIYESSVDGVISIASDTDSFTLEVDDGQTITVVLDPAATLDATLELFDPSSNSLASTGSSGAGLDAVLQ
ncbi:MAG: pre-peptidase C-terminal domain-containing protein, partial [Planctomycetes bacterium]|nr:pre-peptidase C-terminal domain-containing protein [Planctomycetota bacterium]